MFMDAMTINEIIEARANWRRICDDAEKRKTMMDLSAPCPGSEIAIARKAFRESTRVMDALLNAHTPGIKYNAELDTIETI
jgi:hypothetical protein